MPEESRASRKPSKPAYVRKHHDNGIGCGPERRYSIDGFLWHLIMRISYEDVKGDHECVTLVRGLLLGLEKPAG